MTPLMKKCCDEQEDGRRTTAEGAGQTPRQCNSAIHSGWESAEASDTLLHTSSILSSTVDSSSANASTSDNTLPLSLAAPEYGTPVAVSYSISGSLCARDGSPLSCAAATAAGAPASASAASPSIREGERDSSPLPSSPVPASNASAASASAASASSATSALTSISDTTALSTVGMHASVPYFALSSETSCVQQDVIVLSTGGSAAGSSSAASPSAASAAAAPSLMEGAGDGALSPRDSSSTGNAFKASVALELLECGVCMERMQPPIYQCREGHTLCCSCRQRLSSCPTCRSPELNIRCRALEVLAQGLTDIPCRFAIFGCTYTMKYSDAQQHESRCLRRPLVCLHADSGCAFEASPQQLAEHLLQQHGYEYRPSSNIRFVCTPRNCRGSTRIGKAGKTGDSIGVGVSGVDQGEQQGEEEMIGLDGCECFVWQQQLYHCFGKYFVLRIHRRVEGEAAFYLSLLALHPRHHCSRYSLQVSGNHRTYSFHGPVWSAARGPKELERVKDCLLLPENIALFLSGAKGSEQNLNAINLSVTGEILPS